MEKRMHFEFTQNYEQELDDYIVLLKEQIYQKDGTLLTHTQRIHIVNKLIDAYKYICDTQPSELQLKKLSDYILQENTFNQPTKEREYPFLSRHQMQRRRQKESSDFIFNSIDTEGFNHTPPTRTERIESETRRNNIKI